MNCTSSAFEEKLEKKCRITGISKKLIFCQTYMEFDGLPRQRQKW